MSTNNIKALVEQVTHLDTVDAVLTAAALVHDENLRIKRTGEASKGRLMPLAGQVTYAARQAGVYAISGATKPLLTAKQVEDGQVQEFPVSGRDYAKMMGYSQTYIGRLYRLGNFIVNGKPDKASLSVVQSHGSATEFAPLDGDASDVTPEKVTEMDAARKANIDSRRKAAAEKGKRDKSTETETETEEFYRHIIAAQALVGSLGTPDEAERAVEMLAALLASVTDRRGALNAASEAA